MYCRNFKFENEHSTMLTENSKPHGNVYSEKDDDYILHDKLGARPKIRYQDKLLNDSANTVEHFNKYNHGKIQNYNVENEYVTEANAISQISDYPVEYYETYNCGIQIFYNE